MPSETNDIFERIREKLGRLRTLDAKCTLFGAASHGYRIGRRLTEADLRYFERQLGVVLPSGYREFLAEIGDGCAGPGYGLFAIDDKDPENITVHDTLSTPFRWTEAFNPDQGEKPTEEDGAGFDECRECVELPIPGALYLCHSGCALRIFLVVAGPCRGEVWQDSQADGTGIYPANDGEGRRVGFLEWYEQWLDRSLAKFQASTNVGVEPGLN